MQVHPYLSFNGQCEEAIAFYRAALGAEQVMLMRFRDAPEPMDPARVPPAMVDKVMHARLRIGESVLLLSDGAGMSEAGFRGFHLTLTVADAAEADRAFAALADGGKVQMPLAQTFFSPRFGMLQDRFGVGWMVYVAQ
jgi:PhnB protein